MMNRELILYDGERIYPAYLGREERDGYVKRFGEKRGYMRCGCRDDAELFYRFSSDGRIYPEHKDYAHARGCIFAQADRKQQAFVRDGETGETRVFLSFDPKDFSAPARDDGDDGGGGGMGRSPSKRKDDGLSYYPLEDFVRQINADTFNERMAMGKGVLSADYFLPCISGRLRHIMIDGYRKPLKDYRLDEDRWQFFYLPFEGYEIKEKDDGRTTCSLTVKDREKGKEYRWFVYQHTLEVAVDRFRSYYGCSPMEVPEGTKVIMSGFRYLRCRKGSRDTYRVAGRLCFFMVNANGIIGRTTYERDSLDTICGLLRHDAGLRFFLCDAGEDTWGYFEKKGDAAKYAVTYPESEYTGNVLACDFEREALTREALGKFLDGC